MQIKLPSVLLVDDDPTKRLFLKLFLLRTFETEKIYECDSGGSAMEYLLRHDVTVVITDYKMQPVDGLELTRWIRAQSPDLPILMVTGHPEIHAEARKAGANFVANTSQLADLERALRSAMLSSPVSSG